MFFHRVTRNLLKNYSNNVYKIAYLPINYVILDDILLKTTVKTNGNVSH